MATCSDSCPYALNVRKCFPDTTIDLSEKILVLWDSPTVDEERDGQLNLKTDRVKLFLKTVKRFAKKGTEKKLFHDFAIRCCVEGRPAAATINSCREYFEEVMAEQRPKAVILIGDSALRVATKKTGITKQCHKTFNHATGVPMTVVLSPNSVLHSKQSEEKFNASVKYAVEAIENTGMTITALAEKVNVSIAPTVQQIKAFADRVKKENSPVAFDTETTTLSPYIGDDWRVLCIGLSDGKTTLNVACDNPGEEEGKRVPVTPEVQAVLDILTDPEIKKIAHNVKYDLHILSERYSVNVHPIYEDTLILHRVLYTSYGGHDLKNAASEMLGFPDYTVELKQYIGEGSDSGKYARIPYPVLALYCGIDCYATIHVYKKLLKRCLKMMREMGEKIPELPYDKTLLKSYREIVFPALLPLFNMERSGFKLNKAYVDDLRKRLIKEQEETLQKILSTQQVKRYIVNQRAEIIKQPATAATTRKLKELTFNPASTKQMAEVLFSPQGYNEEPIEKTPGGAPSTSEKVLVALTRKGGMIAEFCDAVIRYRSIGKHLSTFVEGVMKETDKDDVVHSSFNLFSTVTGRGSSSNPNLQNIPRDRAYRDMFCAHTGDVLIEADYRQLELKLLAAYSGDPVMLSVYKEGRDLHTETAMAILGTDDPEDVTSEIRTTAKAVNFGIAYGMTAHGLARQLSDLLERDVSEEDAQPYIDAFYSRYVGVGNWHIKVKRFAEKHGYVTTMFGTRRDIPEAAKTPRSVEQKKGKEEALRHAINTPIQGTGGLCTMVAIADMQRKWQEMPQRKIICYVHDSILISVPVKEASLAIRDLKNSMEKSPLKYIGNYLNGITLDVDIDFGKAWGSLVPLKTKGGK